MIIILLTIVLSLNFNTSNFIKVGYGLTNIISNREEIFIIRNNPKVFISSPEQSIVLLKKMMNDEGYFSLDDERISSTLVFPKGNEIVYVEFSLNKYYSLWKFV